MHCSTRQLLALQMVNMSLEYGKDKVRDDMLGLWFIQEDAELYHHTCMFPLFMYRADLLSCSSCHSYQTRFQLYYYLPE